MKKRTATIEHKTAETRISLTMDLDGTGKVSASTGIGFLDHMLDHIGKHSGIDISVTAEGDLDVDEALLGLKGSPTRVVKIAKPVLARKGRMVDVRKLGSQGVARELAAFLEENQLL